MAENNRNVALPTDGELAEYPCATLLEQTRRQRDLYANVISALPVRLLMIDSDLTIVLANPAYCHQRGLSQSDVHGKNIADVFPESLLRDAGLGDALTSTLQTAERVQWSGYRYATEDHGERTLNMRLDPVADPSGRHNVLLTLEDITERHRQLYERSVLQQTAKAMLGMLDLPRLLHAILTAMTAGGAVGLGFNRAFLMLVDEETDTLRTKMAVGPPNTDEALQIWSNVETDYTSIEDFLADYESLETLADNRFADVVSDLQMPLGDTHRLPVSALHDRKTTHVIDATNDPRVPDSIRQLLQTDEFVIAPLVARDRNIGIAYADNLVNRQPISELDVQLFTSLANHAALAIDSAGAYEEVQRRASELEAAYEQLQTAQEAALRSESLAAIGEMTAIVAHEIRNPLTTIGGFANLMLRQAEHPDKVQRNSRVIYDEVIRLENILSGLLGFSRPSRPHLQSCDVCQILYEGADTIGKRLNTSGIRINVECSDQLPAIRTDRRQLHQVLDNLIRNAVDAMPESGTITLSALPGPDDGVTLQVADTGIGIPAADLHRIFDTFFTTKSSGMGLGLALSKKIVQDQGAEMLVESQPGRGTTFSIIFPANRKDANRDETEPIQPEQSRAAAG